MKAALKDQFYIW